MSGMAEVLAAHGYEDLRLSVVQGKWIRWYCKCGTDVTRDYYPHVEDMLTAAGFGPVKEAAAVALEDAAAGWSDWDALQAPEDWLRARAAAMRAEG